jgi:hypothetical protein
VPVGPFQGGKFDVVGPFQGLVAAVLFLIALIFELAILFLES